MKELVVIMFQNLHLVELWEWLLTLTFIAMWTFAVAAIHALFSPEMEFLTQKSAYIYRGCLGLGLSLALGSVFYFDGPSTIWNAGEEFFAWSGFSLFISALIAGFYALFYFGKTAMLKRA